MARPLGNTLASWPLVAPVVMATLATAMWARSYFATDAIDFRSAAGNRYSIASARGSIVLERQYDYGRWDLAAAPPTPGWSYGRPANNSPRAFTSRDLRVMSADGAWRFAGFGLYNNPWTFTHMLYSTRPPAWQNTLLFGPYWALLLALLLPVAWRVGGEVRRGRAGQRNLCGKCGYDLRATPDRCPECGTPAVAARESEAGR